MEQRVVLTCFLHSFLFSSYFFFVNERVLFLYLFLPRQKRIA